MLLSDSVAMPGPEFQHATPVPIHSTIRTPAHT